MATTDDLLAQIATLETQLKSLQGDEGYSRNFSGLDFTGENNRIEKYLSDFTSREGVLLTIASLLSVLPIIDDKKILLYFLIWICPFLILGIITYIFSAKRINITSQPNKIFPLFEANKILKENYSKVAKLHNLTDVLLVSFFASFLFNYYFISFIDLPGTLTPILIAILATLCGIFRYLYILRVDKFDKFSGLEIMGVGAVSPDVISSVIKDKN